MKKNVALTGYVRKAGCASKIGQADLMRILRILPQVTDPNVLVGTTAGEDACVHRIDVRHALVQTVDVFTRHVRTVLISSARLPQKIQSVISMPWDANR